VEQPTRLELQWRRIDLRMIAERGMFLALTSMLRDLVERGV